MRHLGWLLLGLLALPAQAAEPSLTWQARLMDGSGVPLNTTDTVVVSLYGGGTPLWRKTYLNQPFEDGYLSLELSGPDDSAVALDPTWFGRDVLVGIAVGGGDELSPQMSLNAVPRAAAVIGHVQPTDNTGLCTASLAGTLRWHAGTLQVCANTEEWTVVGLGGPEIASINVQSGAAGQVVTVTGDNFTAGQMTATLDGMPIALGNQTTTSFTYTSPASPLDEAVRLVVTDNATGQTLTFMDAWTRTVAIQEFLLTGSNSTWTVPYPGLVIDVVAVGGGGAGGRSYRTGGSEDSYGGGGAGGGLAVLQDYVVPPDITQAVFSVGQGTDPSDPNYSGVSNQCLRNPTGDGVSTDGTDGGETRIAFGADLVVTAQGGTGGNGGPDGSGGSGGLASVSGAGAAGLPVGIAQGGAGSGVDQGQGFDGGSIVVNGVTYRAAGGGGAGSGQASTPNSRGGAGDSASFTGGGGGGGADSPGAGGAGGSGFRSGGAGENSTSNGGFDGAGGTFNGVVVLGGQGGTTGNGLVIPGESPNETGRRNAGGGGGLFGGGGGGGGDSCPAGGGGGAQGVIVLSY